MRKPDDAAEAVAHRLGELTGGPPVSFERVPPGEEQVLPDREQRELDSLPSMFALRKQTSR